MKKILIIAYHYPPVKISSAVQRILKFSSYLPEHQWQPIVLTIHPRAALTTSDEQMAEIPSQALIHRSFALDTVRHLTIKGKYFKWMALPDRWLSWVPFAIFDGLRLIKKHQPDVIFSTYPIISAHIIGYMLSKLTGRPWVADFRDSMTDESFPTDPMQRRVFERWEKRFVHQCSKVIFTTHGARKMYSNRYPNIDSSVWAVISNGYDEQNFQRAEQALSTPPSPDHTRLTLVHSGLIYSVERNPEHFFSALATMKKQQILSVDNFLLILRATGNDEFIDHLISQYNISDLVSIKPTISYQNALQEMLQSDGLIILQASNCNHQIPAKAYEYLRSKKPIFALTDEQGDTAQLLRDVANTLIAPIDNETKIIKRFTQFIELLKKNEIRPTPMGYIQQFSRKEITHQLARLLDKLS